MKAWCWAGAAGLILAAAANGQVTWSTGDLGINVIDDAGDFTVFPDLVMPDNSQPAELTVIYGLWNSPDVPVDVFLNGTLVGNFVADQGYINPGPETATFDVSGMLLDGLNEVFFTGHSANSGDYVIGQVDLTYFQVPTPGAMAMLGLAGLAATRRRR